MPVAGCAMWQAIRTSALFHRAVSVRFRHKKKLFIQHNSDQFLQYHHPSRLWDINHFEHGDERSSGANQ